MSVSAVIEEATTTSAPTGVSAPGFSSRQQRRAENLQQRQRLTTLAAGGLFSVIKTGSFSVIGKVKIGFSSVYERPENRESAKYLGLPRLRNARLEVSVTLEPANDATSILVWGGHHFLGRRPSSRRGYQGFPSRSMRSRNPCRDVCRHPLKNAELKHPIRAFG